MISQVDPRVKKVVADSNSNDSNVSDSENEIESDTTPSNIPNRTSYLSRSSELL